MPHRDVKKYLYDISEACRLIEEFTAGKAYVDYHTDPLLRSAVERQFEIIGEALRLLLQCDSAMKERISNAPRIIDFRNRLIHGYATVSDEVVWGVV